MKQLTQEQRDWVLAEIENEQWLASDGIMVIGVKVLRNILTANTTEDDMRKHKWSEGETNQALTTDDEPIDFLLGKAYHLISRLSSLECGEVSANADIWLLQYENWLNKED